MSHLLEPRPAVPVILPALVQANADKNRRGDTEKESTTTIDKLVWRGITMTSRWGKAADYEAMMDLIEAMRTWELAPISSIYCDTDNLFYDVTLKHGSDRFDAIAVDNAISRATVSFTNYCMIYLYMGSGEPAKNFYGHDLGITCGHDESDDEKREKIKAVLAEDKAEEYRLLKLHGYLYDSELDDDLTP